MKLSFLLAALDAVTLPTRSCDPETEIENIASDSRAVTKNSLFVCIRGGKNDGHLYVSDAVKNGAAAILCERVPDGAENIPIILTPDTRAALSELWNTFCGFPGSGMTKIAVTGTAGKTSVTLILEHILSCAGFAVGRISTVGAASRGAKLECGNNGGSSLLPEDTAGAMTTPDPEYFFGAMRKMRDDGCSVMIYEASSQSLLRKTTSAIIPDIAVYTNLSPEHLDAHGSMENYFAAKTSLLCGVKKAVINADDAFFPRLPTLFPDCGFTSVSCKSAESVKRANERRVTAKNISLFGDDGTEYVYFSDDAVFRAVTPLAGLMSVYNTMEAAACAMLLGADAMTVKEALASGPVIPGRCERVAVPHGYERVFPRVYIDYAHTPGALDEICRTMRGVSGDGRLTVLFGCGGDRDRAKRHAMLEAAEKYADRVIVTSDNPRSEDPERIISDIIAGESESAKIGVIPDRREAIRYAVTHSGAGDTVLLAGKGHEKYEIRGGRMLPFDEEKIVSEIFAERTERDGKTDNRK